MNPQQILAATEVFSSLPAQHIEQIATRLQRMEIKKDQNLVVQGQPGDALFIIESGRFGVFIKDKDFGLSVEVAQLGPGDCLGELALVTGAPRNATCTALNDAVVHRLDKPVFDAILGQSISVQMDMLKTLAKRLTTVSATRGVPFVSLANIDPDPQLTALVPLHVMKKHSIAPIEFDKGSATIAAVDPANATGLEMIRNNLRGVRVRTVAVAKDDFDLFLEKIAKAEMKTASQTGGGAAQIRFIEQSEEGERATLAGQEILALANKIIATGVESDASDIHVEPSRNGTRVRYRINGSLESRMDPIPSDSHKSLLSRFKILAKLDITETRRPQEGRISMEFAGRAVDLRLSLIPSKLGQKLVMRILDASTSLVPLDKLVLAEKVRTSVRKMFYAPHGVVLVTGPTGSGKTTTMYSGLLERRNPELNIVTVEDPVEFHLDGLTQVEVGNSADLSFSGVLHAFLRQDPDIILVGETRDSETAKMALQAGLTGRLVLTSFHTNSCVGAIVRLAQMGMEPFAMANALVGVIHQRLVRRICHHCREPFEFFPQIIDNLRAAGLVGEKVPVLYRSKGCPKCQGQGYLGRVAALEVLMMTDEVKAAVAKQAPPEEILAAAKHGAFVPLSRYMAFLLQHGITVPGEALGALPRRGN